MPSYASFKWGRVDLSKAFLTVGDSKSEAGEVSMAAKKGAKMAGRKGPVARLPNGFEQL